jgi:hypothetical protein
MGVPGVAALVAALWQILQDQAAHNRQLDLQEKQRLFDLGVASHMANIAFDKHVAFSEQYISKMHEAIGTMFKEGPSKTALTLSWELGGIRQTFRAWITQDVEAKLVPFETALREIGAADIALVGMAVGEQRSKTVGKMYDTFSRFLGIPREGRVDEAAALNQIIGHLQDLLGVDQLSRLRSAAMINAIRALERKT